MIATCLSIYFSLVCQPSPSKQCLNQLHPRLDRWHQDTFPEPDGTDLDRFPRAVEGSKGRSGRLGQMNMTKNDVLLQLSHMRFEDTCEFL